MNPDAILNPCVTIRHVIPDDTVQFFLPLYLKHPAILKLRNAGIGMSGISRATPGFLLHRIPRFRFVLLTCSGNGEVVAAGRKHEFSSGSFCILNADQEQFYRQVGNEPWIFCWFHLDPNTPLLEPKLQLPCFGRGLPLIQLEAAMKGLAIESIHRIRNLENSTSDERPPWHFYCDSMDLRGALYAFGIEPENSTVECDSLIALYADQILELLGRKFHLLCMEPKKLLSCDLWEKLWRKVGEALERKWTLNDMASVTYMSVSSLLRESKKRYDATPMQILYHLRLKQARNLLVSTRLPISRIALQCGYDNFAAFSTAFKKEYGLPPRKYRIRSDAQNG